MKSLISYENKQAIKKYIFPYKFITQQQTLINQQQTSINQQQTLINQYKDELILNKEYLAVIKNYEKDIRFEQTQKNIYIDKIREFDKLPVSQFEMDFQKNFQDIPTQKTRYELSNKDILTKYRLVNGFFSGTNQAFPGSGILISIKIIC